MGPARARALTLDAGALIAFERGDGRMRALLRGAVDSDASLVVPAGALAQSWRDGRRQARLAALLSHRTCLVEVIDEAMAKAAGALCGRTGTADVIDASVVLTARLHDAAVVTADSGDLRQLDPGLVVHQL